MEILQMPTENNPMGIQPSLARDRRCWLRATAIMGVSGTALLAVPLVRSLLPPEEQTGQAQVVLEVDISTLQPGEKRVVQWRGKPVWILRRTPAMLAALQAIDPAALSDPGSLRPNLPLPAFARNPWRSRRPDLFVCIGLCPHLGCSPTDKLHAGAHAGLPADWPGGFVCPCHGSTFDLAGRVFRNKAASDNLEIPPYVFVSENRLLIGTENIPVELAST